MIKLALLLHEALLIVTLYKFAVSIPTLLLTILIISVVLQVILITYDVERRS